MVKVLCQDNFDCKFKYEKNLNGPSIYNFKDLYFCWEYLEEYKKKTKKKRNIKMELIWLMKDLFILIKNL